MSRASSGPLQACSANCEIPGACLACLLSSPAPSMVLLHRKISKQDATLDLGEANRAECPGILRGGWRTGRSRDGGSQGRLADKRCRQTTWLDIQQLKIMVFPRSSSERLSDQLMCQWMVTMVNGRKQGATCPSLPLSVSPAMCPPPISSQPGMGHHCHSSTLEVSS